jgi:hypothetical protein
LAEKRTKVLLVTGLLETSNWTKTKVGHLPRPHCYEKLGIHTRQELIDMIEDV